MDVKLKFMPDNAKQEISVLGGIFNVYKHRFLHVLISYSLFDSS
jgi:hypothetical protein